MNTNHVPFWIASDLLAQARAYGIELSGDFAARLVGIVRDEQRQWMTEDREAVDDRKRRARRRTLTDLRGWF